MEVGVGVAARACRVRTPAAGGCGEAAALGAVHARELEPRVDAREVHAPHAAELHDELRAVHGGAARHGAAPTKERTRASAHREERVHVRRRLAERADDEPAHGPELAQASEDGSVAGATWHAAAGGVDVARVPLVLAGDRARARFDGRAARRVDAVGVGVARAVDVDRLDVVVRVVAGGELHARVGRDRVLRRPPS